MYISWLGTGTAWVNSVAYAIELVQTELICHLHWNTELHQPTQSAPVNSSWCIELRVLTLNPVKNMIIEVTFNHDLFFLLPVSVGVDDVQLAQVLNFFPLQH
jgi:hypothetical protein